jgi:uncharacterized repeat protein (TIGR03803 family)
MDSKNQFCNLLCEATAALAIAFMLIVVAAQPAQAQTYSVIHNFTGAMDGRYPYAGVTLDKAGNVYGTTYGYPGSYGTVYELKHKGSGWTVSPLYSFTGGYDGAYPTARVIFGPNGTLYGTTEQGGSGYGSVFNLRPSAAACRTALCPWTETVLYAFADEGGAFYPLFGDLLFDQAGNIYGTTQSGGQFDAGTVYEMTGSGSNWTESVLYSFAGTDGNAPYAGVIFDSAGNLYGTTYYGGLDSYGTVFELTKSIGWTESCINSFRNGSDGSYPWAGLIFDQSDSKLYGATSDGGTGGGGTVFELTPGANCNWTLKTLYSFTGGYQCGPRGTLFMDPSSSNLYGTTYCDGKYGFGNIWELIYPNWTYKDLYDFTGANDGGNPISNVVFDANGNLYGTTYGGGSQGVGVVWEITP